MDQITTRIARPKPLSADPIEKLLAWAALALLLAALTAIFRGRADLGGLPPFIALHLLTILVALVLTPVILLRRRGDQRHRWLGRVWAGAMFLTAALSLFVQTINPGHFSWIHILSLFTLVQVPRIVWTARNHRVVQHRRSVRLMVTGALLIAGVFTLLPSRQLGHWLFQ